MVGSDISTISTFIWLGHRRPGTAIEYRKKSHLGALRWLELSSRTPAVHPRGHGDLIQKEEPPRGTTVVGADLSSAVPCGRHSRRQAAVHRVR